MQIRSSMPKFSYDIQKKPERERERQGEGKSDEGGKGRNMHSRMGFFRNLCAVRKNERVICKQRRLGGRHAWLLRSK